MTCRRDRQSCQCARQAIRPSLCRSESNAYPVTITPGQFQKDHVGTVPVPSSSPAVSVLVVSYNTRAMTLDCLRSLAAETRVPHEVIVVDNASTDGSAGAIAAEFPGVRLMAETVNHGFAGANNLAAARARGDYLLLLNPDTVVLDGAVDRLLAFARRRPEAGIWGGRTLYGDGRLNPASCWRRMTPWNLFCRASGADRPLPALGPLQPRGLRRLGPRQRARGRHRHRLLPPDPPRALAAARRLRPDLLHVRRGGRPLPARPRPRRRGPASRPRPRSCTTAAPRNGCAPTRWCAC
jgi:hypothetical protein